MGVSIADFDCVGFSGSRHGAPDRIIGMAISKIAPSAIVCVGCAVGVDEQVRRRVDADRLKVFRASDYPGQSYPHKLANRSSAMVQHLSESDGCLIAFPMAECPNGVIPCQQWRSAKGSGTWGTIALSVGLGIPTMIWLPTDIAAPEWGDRLEQINRNWWLSLPF
jgi:hypothetical protein